MIYAIVRGWLAGMGSLLVEILLAAIFFAPSFSSLPFTEESTKTFLPIAFVALLEESMKFLALRGISSETIPFFRNAIFKGLLVGVGFALFEICVKVLFQVEATRDALLPGAMSGAFLHIVTGGILGTAWFFRTRNRGIVLFLALFLCATLIHILYNSFLSPLLFERFS